MRCCYQIRSTNLEEKEPDPYAAPCNDVVSHRRFPKRNYHTHIHEGVNIPLSMLRAITVPNYLIKGTSHDFKLQISLFSTLADIFAV